MKDFLRKYSFTPLEKAAGGFPPKVDLPSADSPEAEKPSITQTFSPVRIRLRRTNGIRKQDSLTGFTLVEIMVALAVFAIIIVGAAGLFISVRDSWRIQKTNLELAQNARWAMEFITNEVRHSSIGTVVIQESGRALRFGVNTDGNIANGDDQRVVYWRGNDSVDSCGGSSQGYQNYLYRGIGNNVNNACPGRHQIADFIADNPNNDPIFIENGGVVTITLTVENNNKNLTLRSRVRPRN